jgi:hypothetical protein
LPSLSEPTDQPESASEQAEAAAVELFASMFRDSFRQPGDLNDYYMDQFMRQASIMSPEQLQQFSDRFQARTSNILGRLQVLSQPQDRDTFLQTLDGSTLEGNSLNGSTLAGNSFGGPFEDQAMIPNDDLWLPYLPVPSHMLPVEAQAQGQSLSEPAYPDPRVVPVLTIQDAQWSHHPYNFIEREDIPWGYSSYASMLMAAPTLSMYHSRQRVSSQVPV